MWYGTEAGSQDSTPQGEKTPLEPGWTSPKEANVGLETLASAEMSLCFETEAVGAVY